MKFRGTNPNYAPFNLCSQDMHTEDLKLFTGNETN